ncbi:thioesterase II family protein [Arenibaculum sp.]|jgi:surfactin synthase thioesterase subunit|uniref:thioesterase II family protein n=1 Tax=Arenibaculum sp. TaxID=2865862 RepID=UPI002E0D7F05
MPGTVAGTFMDWQRLLGDGIEVQALEMPGRGRRIGEAPGTDMEATVAAVADAVRPLLDRPAFFFGHSLGAVVAFEVVRRLRDPAIRHLFVSACAAPSHLPTPRVRRLAEMEGPDFLDGIRGYGELAEEILADEDLLAIFLSVLKADFTMIARYAYRPAAPLDHPVTVLFRERDPHVAQEHLADWQRETVHPVARYGFDGGHFFVAAMPARVVGLIADRVRRSLADDALR